MSGPSSRNLCRILAVAACVHAQDWSVVPRWQPKTVQDLHREYSQIFKHGNRKYAHALQTSRTCSANFSHMLSGLHSAHTCCSADRSAASHLWSAYIFDRSEQLTASTLELMFSGFCVVSGSPTRPGDYTRYRLRLPLVGGGTRLGYMYYCCWPCVCDTQDFIRADTRNVTLAGGEVRQYHWAVVGNPCDHPAKLKESFTQPFYDRGPTTLEREAPEVRCDADGKLIGAYLSDHGYPIIGMFFDAVDDAPTADGSNAVLTAASSFVAQPGRMRHAPGGVQFQDESEYGPMCTDRASKGYNSGMGEIFRKVASISPVVVRLQLSASEVGAAASPRALSEGADANESCESPNSEA